MILIRAGGLPFPAWQSLVPDKLLDTNGEKLAVDAAKSVREAFDQLLAAIPDSEFRTLLYNARKAFFQNQKWPSETAMFALESRQSIPLVSTLLERLHAWNKASAWENDFEVDYLKRLDLEWQALQQVAGKAEFRRSLLFASHDLLKQLPAFCAKKVDQFDKKDRQTALSTLQYLSRSIFKTSPLGRFTSVQLWKLGETQQPGFDAEKFSITPNVAMLPALYEVLLREAAFYQSLDLLLNPCVPAALEENDILSWLYFDGEQEAFQRLAPNAVVRMVVQTLLENNRKFPYLSLFSFLKSMVDAPEEQVKGLIQELIALGLLEWDLPEKGLTPSWCGNLSQYLSFLPSAPVLTDAAYLLQLLKGSARMISFQTLEAAQETQVETKKSLETFFEKYASIAPPIPAEQVFFEDVERSLPIQCPDEVMEQFATQLQSCWNQNGFQDLPAFRARLYHFTKDHYKPGEIIDFQAYCALFFETKSNVAPAKIRPYQGKIGAMIQVYSAENGYRAVVNAMFPGGGKLFARWLHLFRSGFREAVEAWNDPDTILFPWQGWSNANFQAIQTRNALKVPDGRVGGHRGQKVFLLTDLAVRNGEDGPELIDKKSGKRILMTDLGLEDPESRPPALQVLWHLGVPYVSSLTLIQNIEWQAISSQVKKRARIEYESLVLARAAWEIDLRFFEKMLSPSRTAAERYRLGTLKLRELEIPRYFFARTKEGRQKPQFFDQESVVSMRLFEKLLRTTRSAQLYFEEMLPLPGDWVLGEKGAQFAGEFVFEMKG